jgi:hypothetical protein
MFDPKTLKMSSLTPTKDIYTTGKASSSTETDKNEFFSFFEDNFNLPGSGSGSTDPFESGFNPGADPKDRPNRRIWIRIRLSNLPIRFV